LRATRRERELRGFILAYAERSSLEIAMCQQWFSVVGLTAEVIGFLLIAYEWRETFLHLVLQRQGAVEMDYVRSRQGDDAAKERELADASMWRNTQRENRLDHARRAKIFGAGVALVVIGTVFQIIGSLPYGISFFHFSSCS
jgi:hypothetical protein